jgi:Family of unknown function (DUF6069)
LLVRHGWQTQDVARSEVLRYLGCPAEFLLRNHWASETVDDLNHRPSCPREVLMTEASTGTGSPSRAALPAGPVWRAGLLAAVAATVVNVVAWLVLQPLLDADLQIPRTPGSTDLVSLSLAPVILVTLLSGVLGAVVLWLLTRRGPSGVRLWVILAVAYAVLSGLAAFGLDVDLGRQLGLFLFHLLAAGTVIAVVRQQLPARPGQ